MQMYELNMAVSLNCILEERNLDIQMNISAFSLKGKTAIITGASRGIGQAIAVYFYEAGANLVLAGRKEEGLQAVAKGFSGKGRVLTKPTHMGNSAQVQALVDFVVASFGRIDVVVNNAATNPVYGPMQESRTDAFDKIFAVNVKGPMELANFAYPHILKTKGNVINLSSIGAIHPERGLGLYNMSKAALISMTKTMAREWGSKQIRVNAICPGLVKTQFSDALTSNEKIMNFIMAKQALPMLAEPEHIAGLALFLASDAGAFCTGGVYLADGGFTI
jgi:NAD(P)-dependent dehydrogenase (short-subunit alcohol dehydrogenase family)